MLIGKMGEPFNSDDYIYELKFDGQRCLAYLSDRTILVNKRQFKVGEKFLELSQLHNQVNARCVLDGEIVVIKDGVPDFSTIQRRSLLTNSLKAKLLSQKYPACFVAFDILYLENKDLTSLELTKRKEILNQTIKFQNQNLAISMIVEQYGIEFFNLIKGKGLEGIVAKLKSSKYFFGKRTHEWIKIKNLLDDDFVVCGYILKPKNNMSGILFGQYDQKDNLVYKGHVTLGVRGKQFKIIKSQKKKPCPLFKMPPNHKDAVWLTPNLVCSVYYMMENQNGGLRQSVFKGLRSDKNPLDCKIK